MGRQPHILAVPYPAQGHVTPLLKLSYQIATQGINVTFVNTEFIHAKIMGTMSDHEKQHNPLTFVSIPDGLKCDDDREDFFKHLESIRRVMPSYLADLIKKMDHEPITCVVADVSVGWIFDAFEEFDDVEKVAFLPAGPAGMALVHQVPKLMQAGLIRNLVENEQISLSKEIPAWNSMELTWNVSADDLRMQKLLLESCLTCKRSADRVNFLLCNTFYELDSSSCKLIPNILTVGPLRTSAKSQKSGFTGSFWLEDDSCLTWLDQQQPGSVVYVAFGSIAVFSQEQFEELALGLEQSGKPFLWVVRSPDYAYPDGFLDRVADRGKIVEWAPQERVLAHPSIACFLTHCGWNSTIEGISEGIPFLCWTYFADQFHNQKCICEFWKVGLKLNPGKNGIRSRMEICKKIENLLSDDDTKVNALKLKDLSQISMSKGGTSFRNLEKFINHLKN